MRSVHEHIKFFTSKPGEHEQLETLAVSFEGGLYVAAPADRFGREVKVSETHIVAGAFGDDDAGVDSGSVYVYEFASGSHPEYIGKLTADDGTAGHGYGNSISLSASHLAVGAADSDSQMGAVYFYELMSQPFPTFVVKLTDPDGEAGDKFGCDIGLSSFHLAVGACADDAAKGSVFLYEVSGASPPRFAAKLVASDGAASDYFGVRIAISSTHLAVCARFNDNEKGSNAGAVYLYELSSGSPPLFVTKLTQRDGASGDTFGETDMALSDTHLAVSSRDDDLGTDSGSVSFYNISKGSAPVFVSKLVAFDGSSRKVFGHQ
eukprot:gene23465-28409_t